MRRVVRACRSCHMLKPLHLFGVGREQHVCNDCAVTTQRKWIEAGTKITTMYARIHDTRAKHK